ncbi:MAG: hypothetical protein GX308_08830 [Epulopiscium sp.]|nr:hypothetical protein [Candidatus Epulonipiscium sp.]
MSYKKQMMAILSVIVVIGFFFTGCQRFNLSKEEYVATINGEKIGIEEYNIYLWKIKQVYQSVGQEDIWETKFDGKPAEEVAKERALETIKNIKIQVHEAKKIKLSLTEEEKSQVKLGTDTLITQVGEEEMNRLGISKLTVEKVMEENVLCERLFVELTKDFVGNKEEFEKFFEENGENFKKVKAKHILLKTHDIVDGKLTTLSEKEQKDAKKKADEALERAKSGEDFSDLVQEYSQDEASLPTNGEYTFGKGEMDKNFEDASFALKTGEISDLVESAYGYHIIKLEEEIEPDKDIIEDNYYEIKKEEFYNSRVQEWVNDADLEINEEVWKTIKIK